ncbi:hypothetical protein MRX96_024287 [Rhipicephalus microplus]
MGGHGLPRCPRKLSVKDLLGGCVRRIAYKGSGADAREVVRARMVVCTIRRARLRLQPAVFDGAAHTRLAHSATVPTRSGGPFQRGDSLDPNKGLLRGESESSRGRPSLIDADDRSLGAKGHDSRGEETVCESGRTSSADNGEVPSCCKLHQEQQHVTDETQTFRIFSVLCARTTDQCSGET